MQVEVEVDVDVDVVLDTLAMKKALCYSSIYHRVHNSS